MGRVNLAQVNITLIQDLCMDPSLGSEVPREMVVWAKPIKSQGQEHIKKLNIYQQATLCL